VDSSDACRLVEDLPPRRHEIFSLPYGTARRVLPNHGRASTAIVVRGGDVEPLEWREGTPDTPRIRPGDVVVLDSTAALFTASAAGFSPPVVVDDPDERAAPADDVLEARPDPAPGEVVHRIESPDLLSALLDEQEPDRERELVRGWLADRPDAMPMAVAALELLSGDAVLGEIVIHRDADGSPVRALIVDRRRAAADEGIRQVWTPAGKEVTRGRRPRADGPSPRR
jgi:hypothetical protein